MASQLQTAIDELVIANRILAAEKVCDAFGHVSIRHPDDPRKFLLSRGRAPELIEASDIMQFTLEGATAAGNGKPYLERFIHGAIYEARPDVQAVVHSHSYSVVPFSVIGEKLRPIMHVCATIGADIPVWDPQHNFGDTDLLVADMQQGRDLARALGRAHVGPDARPRLDGGGRIPARSGLCRRDAGDQRQSCS